MFKQINQIRPLFDRQDKFRYLGLLLLMLVGALLDVVGIGTIPAFVATLAVPEKVFALPYVGNALSWMGITTGRQLVIGGAIGLIVIFIVKNMYLFLVYSLQIKTTEYHRVRLSTRLFSAYMYAPWEFHLQKNSAELFRNVWVETHEIITGIINPLLNLVMGSMMTLMTVVLLVVTTPGLAVTGVGLIGGASWLFLRTFNSKLQSYGEIAREERKKTIKAINQSFASLIASRVNGSVSFFVNTLQKSIANFARVVRLKQVIEKASPSILEMIAVSGLMCILLVLITLGEEPEALVPILALYGAAVARLRQSISQIVSSISRIRFSEAAIPAVVGDLMKYGPNAEKRQLAGNDHSSFVFKESIRLDSVCYTYPEANKRTLKDINIHIRKGESVAFVGATGSGKSTMINLLLGFLKPESGSISVDGKDIQTSLQGWLSNVGYIPQDIVLLDDTVRRNVAFGIVDDKINEEQVWEAIRAAQLADFIDSLPGGLDTIVGERGVRFSGGQIQRIGMARALYNNPDVLVMDEATSALDNRTESYVMKTLERLKEGRTFVMIAHRLSTVSQCDRLYFLKDGRIDAIGTYEELRKDHEGFRKMAEVV